MRPARFTVTAQEGILVCFNKNERDGMIFLQVLQERRQLFQLQAFARVHQQGRTSEVSFTRRVQLRKNRNELDGKIVHAVEAHIFEGVQNGAFP